MKLAQWFWRRWKCEKFTTTTTTMTTTTTTTDNGQILIRKAHLSLLLRWANDNKNKNYYQVWAFSSNSPSLPVMLELHRHWPDTKNIDMCTLRKLQWCKLSIKYNWPVYKNLFIQNIFTWKFHFYVPAYNLLRWWHLFHLWFCTVDCTWHLAAFDHRTFCFPYFLRSLRMPVWEESAAKFYLNLLII